MSGGSGNDRLKGGGGADVIDPGAGKDVVWGGQGGDRFIFGDGYGRTRILDFDEGARHEQIDLSRVTGITGYHDLRVAHMTQAGGNVMIDDGRATIIVLAGIDLADLNKGDFLF